MRRFLPLLLLVAVLGSFAVNLWAGPRPVGSYENAGLKNRHVITFIRRGSSRASGTYAVEPYDNDTGKFVSRSFTGERLDAKDNRWKITFKGGAPYELAPGTKTILWRFGIRDHQQVFIVPTYGKNYETNKYAPYEMVFTPTHRLVR